MSSKHFLSCLVWMAVMVLCCSQESFAVGKRESSVAEKNEFSAAEKSESYAAGKGESSTVQNVSSSASAAEKKDSTSTSQKRLTIGGYGEAVFNYNFYSSNPYRYTYPSRYSNTGYNGRVDIPHAVIMLGYKFNKGWSMGMEVEFEHGGVEVSQEVEGDEAIEFEHEVERGGEVFLEQFWIQKSFSDAANLRAGMIIVPVGLTNSRHEPDKFFTTYRPEGENTILPCTWHQIGLSFHGSSHGFKYQAGIIPGLNSRLFNNTNWINGASASPYEYTVCNVPAGFTRLDYSTGNWRFGNSLYAGGVNNDAYPTITKSDGTTVNAANGTLLIATLDFEYKGKHLIGRGNADYGYLSNAAAIGSSNQSSDHSTFSPYQHTLVGKNAMCFGTEWGVDLLSFAGNGGNNEEVTKAPKKQKGKLFIFSKAEYYDSYVPSEGQTDYTWSDKFCLTAGINYYPIKEIVIKADYTYRFLKEPYNPEPSLCVGIAYIGLFK